MRCLSLHTEAQIVEALKAIGVDPYGIDAMTPKMYHLNILLKGLECRAANIMKQEMLSLGGDVAVARGAVDCSIDKTDAVVMGTGKQLRRFVEKMEKQPFGLDGIAREVAAALECRNRNRFVLKTPRREIRLGDRTRIMGIINMTPDSFSDGGAYADAAAAIQRGIVMEEEGADILDVGGESSRPGAFPVTAEEELRRVIPVIEGLSGKVGIPISVDTTKAQVAEAAIAAGAEIVNDISALRFDKQMAHVAARAGVPVVLMHMRGTPRNMQTGDLQYEDLFSEMIDYLHESICLAESAGVDADSVMIDPGFGFGKTVADNLRLLRGLQEFKVLGKPVVVGTSRKSFIGKVTDDAGKDRLEGTGATTAVAILHGAHIVRVHDVGYMRRVVLMSDAIAKG
jgi:dihydropteroate synthase